MFSSDERIDNTSPISSFNVDSSATISNAEPTIAS